MASYRLDLPPHLRLAAAAKPRPAPSGRGAPPARATDMVQVTTPLGTVTCPPGRLKLNLLQGGMPKRGEERRAATDALADADGRGGSGSPRLARRPAGGAAPKPPGYLRPEEDG